MYRLLVSLKRAERAQKKDPERERIRCLILDEIWLGRDNKAIAKKFGVPWQRVVAIRAAFGRRLRLLAELRSDGNPK